MLRWIIRPVRLLIESLRDEESPHLLALGLTLGMVAGLVPKDNLTATVLATLLLTVRLHLGAAAAAALIFTWVGMLADPLAHRLGLALLTWKPAEVILSRLFDLPFVPWTNLNNTVVLGNLLLGLLLSWPMYWASKRSIEQFGPLLVAYLAKYRLFHVIRGAEIATSWRRR